MGTTNRTKVSRGGRVVIPAKYRKALGIAIGDNVVLRMEKGELRIKSLRASIKAVQDLFRAHVGKSRSIVDELIKERRAEAKRERE
ncbi:MAG: AbrB/MazE/SpoVT family DNA-binding domain-containing protein [Nitrospinae bacterium]|nr:AbrB/MazE/SpoVT family DNA-binding domain-containing protein [Nitrospinota bacterium]